jgi:hypothetical protein
MRAWLIVLLIGLLPGPARAQGPASPTGPVVPPTTANLLNRPNDFAHPSLPWSYFAPPFGSGSYGKLVEIPPAGTPLPPPTVPWWRRQWAWGQVIQYIEVPAQHVAIPVPRAVADSLPLEWHPAVVTIPAYYVAETTAGYYHFPRWSVEQSSYGVYEWRLLPGQFVRK